MLSKNARLSLTAALFFSACLKSKDETSTSALEQKTLSKLVVIADELQPPFNPTIREYTLVGGETKKAKITINTAPTDPLLTVSINGQKLRSDFTTDPLLLVAGLNTFQIELLNSQSARVGSYTLTVQRAADLPDEFLEDLAVSSGYLVPDFSPTVGEYQITAESSATSFTLSPLVAYPDSATLKINGTSYSADKGGYDFDLTVGNNVFEIQVIGSSGRSKTYKVTVIKPAS